MKKKPEQTASGVKFQGTMLLALAVAMVIAGGTAIAMQFLGDGTANPFQQTEVQQNETTEDTEQHQAEPVPADSGASSTDSDAVPPPLAKEEEEWLIPPAKDTVMAGCVLSTYEDGGFIVVGIPEENK